MRPGKSPPAGHQDKEGDPLSRLQQRLADAFVAGAMANGGLLDAACGIDEPGFALGQQAGDFFEHGVERFAGTVDDAAHDGDVDGGLHFGETTLDFVGDLDDVDFDAAAGWARDEGDAAVAQFERTQDLVCYGNLFLRFGGEADADGVTDATGEQEAEANGGFDG